jgi:predicted ATPase
MQVVQQSEADLYRLLSSLQAKEFLYEQPAFPEVEYLFKHALTQEVAYGTLLQEQRKALHERTGQAMEVLYKENLDDRYSELAHHYSQSENTEKAIAYLHLAGQQAVQRSANEEAIRDFALALELLTALPNTTARARKELALQLALGEPLSATKGWSVPEVERVYARARALCEQVSEPSQLMQVLNQLSAVSVTRAEYTTARELVEQLVLVAKTKHGEQYLAEALVLQGATAFWHGEFLSARDLGEQGHALATRDGQWQAAPDSTFFGDPQVLSLSWRALPLWYLGYPDQAHRRMQEGLVQAQGQADSFTLAFSLIYTSWLHQLRREVQATQEQALATVEFCSERGIAVYLPPGRVLLGWALAQQGQPASGLHHIAQGLSAQRAMGARWSRAYHLALHAEAYVEAGKVEEALREVREGLNFAATTRERWHEAELHRLKGELLLQQPQENYSEAEACFQQAIVVAQNQQAKSWELRAATSLARLWQSQGKLTKAHDLLAPVYSWFTEGFDTADLKDAKLLLEELS